jgi:hypothetical protein
MDKYRGWPCLYQPLAVQDFKIQAGDEITSGHRVTPLFFRSAP